ncbi:MAG TPA: GNAT family N-acetyltransferase [Flavilitoribacter sp.]|nr:GNAT family N-acetyltransferase [Flavilitoribacter sp.]HMQ88894.1 GNAT family N-acetyltransferase [Flavilitoribacter sp.]
MEIKVVKGDEARAHIEALGRLRISVFREWPYLYDGNMAYERDYLEAFVTSKDSVLVLAMDGGRVVGASTGLPLAAETPNIAGPVEAGGYDPERVFYFGESVLEPAYRGLGIGVAFFHYREQHARQLDRFHWLAFCGVVRPEGHPLRPAGYVPLDRFWQKRGFGPTDLFARIGWKDIDGAEETEKPLRFWIKSLDRGI